MSLNCVSEIVKKMAVICVFSKQNSFQTSHGINN